MKEEAKAPKSTVQAYMSMACKISLGADIWSNKGLTSSYLGITAHFFPHVIIEGIVLHSPYDGCLALTLLSLSESNDGVEDTYNKGERCCDR